MSTIINEFIQDEDKAVLAKEQGHYYPDNHHRIKPEIKKVFKKLDPEILQRYYYHMLRLGNVPVEVSEETWPTFLKAIELIKPHFKAGDRYPVCMFTPYLSLFLFGSDGVRVTTLDSGLNLKTFTERLEVLKKARQYTNIPGMLSKLEKLKVFTENENVVKHIHFTLRQSGFKHDGVFSSEFTFWCPMAILMLKNDDETKKTIELFKQADIPEKESHLAIYHRFVEAIGKLRARTY